MSDQPKTYVLSTQRIEAFSDGVIAIAITLLILEIRVPHLAENAGEGANLAAELLALWPSYFGYVFSFFVIGIYWANHHHIFSLYKRADHYFVLLNILFLLCISFVPFPTAVLAEYIEHPVQRQTAITLYTFSLFLPAFVWLMTWLYASRNELIDPELEPAFVRSMTRQYILSNVLYLGAAFLSLWNGVAGIAACVAISLLYLLPPTKPRYRSADDPWKAT